MAAGGGYYSIALIGMATIFVTLTIFERFQKTLLASHSSASEYSVHATDISAALRAINSEALNVQASVHTIEAEQDAAAGVFHISFRADFEGAQAARRRQRFFERLTADPSIQVVRTEGEFSGAATN